MRKPTLILLCFALCLTLIVPVAAKKGGGQSPSTVSIDGDVEYDGPAKVHDSQRYFSLTIGVEGKSKTVTPLTYGPEWPGEFNNTKLDSPKSFFSIHYERDGTYDVVTCSLGESYVLKAYGDYDFKQNAMDPTKTDLTITIDPDGSGAIEYYEKYKREGLVLVEPQPDWGRIVFTVTFG